jgi:uncharacterized protein (TIGR02001 family)
LDDSRAPKRLAYGVAVILVATVCLVRPARAQMGASLSLASEDRFRGEAVSHGRPVATLGVAYDAADGPYFGVSLVGVATAHAGAQLLAVEEYAGYARRMEGGLTLDAGLTNAHYTEYYGGHRAVDYQEAYVGLIGRRLSSHIHYSPDYFGHGYATLYGEVDGVWRTREEVRLLAHVGLLAPFDRDERDRVDWRLGVAKDLKGFDLQAAWTGATHRNGRHVSGPSSNALVVSVTRAF